MPAKSAFSIVGLAHKVCLSAEEQGYTPELINTLAEHPTLFRDMLQVQLGQAKITYSEGASFSRDMTQEGWTLLEDTREPWPISIAKLELVPFLKKGEDHIGGEEMVRRSRKELHANLGQRQAEFLLEHQADIPEEFRKYYLIFPGTIWRDRDVGCGVPYLGWIGGWWRLGFYWLGVDFDGSYRLLRPRE